MILNYISFSILTTDLLPSDASATPTLQQVQDRGTGERLRAISRRIWPEVHTNLVLLYPSQNREIALALWDKFGRILGLQDAEIQTDLTGAQSHDVGCASPMCLCHHHRPTHTTRVCAHCQSAQYCGKKCQAE